MLDSGILVEDGVVSGLAFVSSLWLISVKEDISFFGLSVAITEFKGEQRVVFDYLTPIWIVL